MKTTIRTKDGKRTEVNIPDKDRLDAQRLGQKLGYPSFNAFVNYLLYKYQDERIYISGNNAFINYCIKRELIANA